MKQNKRFILLVVMVLLANCLFAGLASAASADVAVTAIQVPANATFSYARNLMDPNFNMYTNQSITLTLVGRDYVDYQATYSDSGKSISGAWSPANGFLSYTYTKVETSNTVNEVHYRKTPSSPVAFDVSSDNSDVVSAPGKISAAISYSGIERQYGSYSWTENPQEWIKSTEVYNGYPVYTLRNNYTVKAEGKLTVKKAGTATITIRAYTKEDIAYGRGYATGEAAKINITIKPDVAGKITLSQKPYTSKMVGESVTAALAGKNVTSATMWANLEAYGNNDILAFLTYTNLGYEISKSGSYVSVPSTWKVRDPQNVQVTVYDWQDVNSKIWFTPDKYTQIALTEYDYTGVVQYRFTDIEWSVSPADAADIKNDGNKATFTFKKAGSVKITASLKGDPSIYASVTYTVSANPDIPAENNQKLVNEAGKTSATVKLIKGVAPETFTLKAKDAKVEIVKFKSSKTSVATIDEKTGVVTIVKDKEGTVQFTGYDKSGNAYTFNLKVKKVPVNKLTVEKKSLTVEAGKTAQIAWATKPAYAYNPAVKFTSSDKKVATVSVTGLVTGVKAGKTTVVVTPKFAKDTVNPVTIKVTVK